jgi:histidine decarboxylase
MDRETYYGPEQKVWIDTLSPIAKSPDGRLLVSPPSDNPINFMKEPQITSAWYQVPSTALSQQQRARALTETKEAGEASVKKTLGFQCNFRDLSHAECVKDFINTTWNNAGSPFDPNNNGLGTLWMERNVLDYYASLWHAKWPHNPNDPESYWGYTLTMGSSEGNLYALWNARDYLSGKYMNETSEKSKSALSSYRYKQCRCPPDTPNAFTPVAFYSDETHYSIMKATEVMMVASFHEVGVQRYPKECPFSNDWPLAVPCEGGDAGPGNIDIEALMKLVDFFSAKGHPVIIIFNYGTTFKGAYDDVKAAGEAIMPILKKNGMYERKHYLEESTDQNAYITRKGFWIHVDGALGAAYAPFLQMAYENGFMGSLKPPPVFDFQLKFVSSIVTSGHKWIGVPWPCGIYISKTKFQLRSPEKAQISYFDSPDLTLTGSRNAHSALVLWSYISTYSYEDQAKKAVEALNGAVYAEERLKQLEAEIGEDLWVMRSPSSLAVCFKRPSKEILGKFILSGHWLNVDGVWRQYVHIYIMAGVTRLIIDELIESLHAPGALVSADSNVQV